MNDEYIVHNSDMDGFAHSHIRNFKACKWIIELSINKKIPHDINQYFIVSLIRINDDKNYVKKLNELLISKKNKKSNREHYFNVNKGINKKK